LSHSALTPYGWNDRWAALFADATARPGDGAPPDRSLPGRVVRHDGTALLVALADGVRSVRLSRRVDPAPAVGDWLVVVDDVPVGVLPRTSLLTRRAAGADSPQSLAANVDVVLVVCGLDRPVTAGRIDRTVTLAWDAGAVPVVVLTKADQMGGAVDDIIAEVAATHPGVDVVATSTVTGDGVAALRAKIGTGTVVLLGQSGAGKSSLTNALVGDDVAATAKVRRGDAKGRHTTTTRQAHLLPGGGMLIDTPGLREVGVWVDPDAVGATFAEVDELAAGCRFADCAHDTEPGCAVTAAVADGALPAERLAGWRALEREATAAARRADPQEQRRYGRRFSRLAKEAQRRKGR
jgi:ribosome biogenesis GTPase / thiamine phosphate phosphatase